MKTKETLTRQKALAWWNNLPVWGNPSKEYYIGLYYSDDTITPERIEEIWLKETNPTTQVVRQAMKEVSHEVRSPKCVRDGLVKPNQKQFKQFDESLFRAYINKFSDEDLYKAHNILTELRLQRSK
jgi:hypothetical protein